MHPIRGEQYCYTHHPSKAAARAESRKRGGVRRRRPKTPVPEAWELRSVADVRGLLEHTISDTLALENGVSRARALGYLANTALECIKVGELEDRVAAMEQRLETMSSQTQVGLR